jgi:hypothetical protein
MRLVEAVRRRPPGETVLDAFRRSVLDGANRLDERAELIAKVARTVAASAARRARERELVAQSTEALAELIAGEQGAAEGDLRPFVAATALMGVQRALVAHVHEAVLAGVRGDALVNDVRARGEAFALLEGGLADYGAQER